MQIIKSYLDVVGPIRFIQNLRLYNMSRPSLRRWRKARHTNVYTPDRVDQLVIQLNPEKIIAVDCAGWYFNYFGINTDCVESNDIAKMYYPACYVEYDVLTHRPTYLDNSALVVLKHPWFLRYATVDQLVNFLNIWTRSTVILEFIPRLIQHNHLKYSLLDIVRPQLNFDIKEITTGVWKIHQ
jgi:hypothetical protein